MGRKKLTVESEGKFYWKDSDDLRKENAPQETNRKFRKVQLHEIDDEAYLVEQEDLGDISKSSPESFLQQAISRHRLVLATSSTFHSYRSLAISSLVLVALAVAVTVFCRKASRSRLRRRQIFKQQEFFKKQEDLPSSVEVKEKGGFSYVELNEKQSPAGPVVDTTNSWASGLASGLAAVAVTPF